MASKLTHHSHPLHPFITWIFRESKVQNGLMLWETLYLLVLKQYSANRFEHVQESNFPWLILKFPDLLNCPLQGKGLILLAWQKICTCYKGINTRALLPDARPSRPILAVKKKSLIFKPEAEYSSTYRPTDLLYVYTCLILEKGTYLRIPTIG